MLYHAKEHMLKIPSGQMRYITFGTGPKPLIMIQGLNTRSIKGAAIPLAYMYRIFTKEYQVYLFDRRTNIEKGITVKELAEDISAAMDVLGISGADVFGVSQGGMIAQYLAIKRPDLIRKLVLAVTLSKNNETVTAAVNGWMEMVMQNNMKQLVADMLDRMYSDNYKNKYRPFLPLLTVLQTPKDPQRFISLASACLTCDTYEQLDRIKCPVFVIGGRQDKVVGAEGPLMIAKKLACEIFMYDEFGHAVYAEAPDFNKRVYDFLMK